MIEADGLNATNPTMDTISLSAFSHELTNVMRNSVNYLSITDKSKELLHGTDEKYRRPRDECESISFEMLLRSLKTQIKDNIKNSFPNEVFSSYFSNVKQPKRYDRARSFITYLLDITTHLAYYRKPVDPQKAVFVQAQFDGYIPYLHCPSPLELWPGSRVEYINCGHIFGAVYKQDIFRKIISDMLSDCRDVGS